MRDILAALYAALMLILNPAATHHHPQVRQHLVLPEVQMHDFSALPPMSLPTVSKSVRFEQPPNQQQEQQVGYSDRGTHENPLIIKQLPHEHSAQEEADENAKNDRDSKLTKYTERLALYTLGLFIATLILAVVTGALFGVAVYQMREGRRATTAAESAARA